MKLINFNEERNFNICKNCQNTCRNRVNYYILLILFIINTIITIYVLIENQNISKIIKEILDFKNTFDYKNNNFKNNFPNNDKEMIGLYYPEINFDKIKKGLQNFNIISSLIDLINQIENTLLYFEKEINITKIVSLYTSRKFFLKEYNITYNEKNIKELHEIINWIVIHKSDQLKGIASDKYLSCKYVKLKLGKNLCDQRIAVYNNFEELNYQKLSKYGDIILKISNSCWKNLFISNNTNKDNFENKLKNFKKFSEFDHGLIDAQFYHLYAKKRIIVEKQFIPLTDLYEFRFFVINNKIKFIMFNYRLNMRIKILMYDSNYNFIYIPKKEKINPWNLTSIFKKNILQELKDYAIRLSEDFKNFIRVDLYVFHDKIYFSELTFASYNGLPIMFVKEKFIKDSVKNFSFIE